MEMPIRGRAPSDKEVPFLDIKGVVGIGDSFSVGVDIGRIYSAKPHGTWTGLSPGCQIILNSQR